MVTCELTYGFESGVNERHISVRVPYGTDRRLRFRNANVSIGRGKSGETYPFGLVQIVVRIRPRTSPASATAESVRVEFPAPGF